MIKKCNNCSVDKELKYFYRNSSNLDGFKNICKLCESIRMKEYIRLNKHKLKEQKAKWYKDTIEERKSKSEAYRKTNHEKELERYKKYHRENPTKRLAYSRKRAIRKIQRTPDWLTKEDFITMESFYELAAELTISTGEVHHVDHIIPLKGALVSGLHVPSNLQVITAKENLAKSNKFVI